MKKLIFVTGAGRGIGRTVALKLSHEGYVVAGCARSKLELEETKKLSFGKIDVEQVDVSNAHELKAWFDSVLKKHPDSTPWGLLTAAGVYGPIGRFHDNAWEEWEKSVNINLYGTLAAVQKFTQILISKNLPGRIVLLSGGGATKPIPHFSSYSATKAAVVRFGETIALELQPFNITVNSIAPGAINTKFLDDLILAGPDKAGPVMYQNALKQKQTGGESPDKAANLVSYLMGPNGGSITAKLISAVWDDWAKFHEWEPELNKTDIYTLRRIVPEDRKKL